MPDRVVRDGHHDGRLVRAAADGDRDAWAELVDRHGDLVLRVAMAHGLARADAFDVVQATWLNLHDHLDRLRDPTRVRGWLRTTARHESLALLRRRGRAQPVDFGPEWDRPSDDPPPDEVVAEAEGDGELRSALARIDARCRSVLLMLAADPPATYVAVAEAVNLRIGSIGSTRKRCLDRLRSLYEEERDETAEREGTAA